MKRSRFTDQQIAYALKQAELGTPISEVCRKMGISDAMFYSWEKSLKPTRKRQAGSKYLLSAGGQPRAADFRP